MTGYERTMTALNRQKTDRPPFDFWAEPPTLNRLYRYLGHQNLEQFLDDMQVDIRSFNAKEPPNKTLNGSVFENMWGERFILRNGEWGDMREDTEGALYHAKSLEELMSYPWPDNDMLDYSQLRGQCREAREKELAIRYGYADIWQRPAMVRGLENHLLDMVVNPTWVHFLSRTFTDFYCEDFRRAWEASGGGIDIFMVISDVGTQRGPLISQDMFDTFIAPYLWEMADCIHGFGSRLMFHSCGDVAAFIPSIIQCGVDILNPIQPVGCGMKPEALKQFTGEICFHGGIDVQRLLPFGTEAQIHEELKRYARCFETGYIACPAHFFQPDTPPENIAAFYRAFND